jgi:hypothetical protein
MYSNCVHLKILCATSTTGTIACDTGTIALHQVTNASPTHTHSLLHLRAQSRSQHHLCALDAHLKPMATTCGDCDATRAYGAACRK